MTSLQDIKSELNKHLSIKDPFVLDLVFACILGNTLIETGSIWMLLVGSSSTGKTSITNPLLALPTTYFLDDITNKTFLSGFRMNGKFQNLLDIINRKTVIFSDFSTILSKNQEQRGEILAQFRRIADGQMDKATGTGTMKWAGKIGILAASTPDIYNHLEVVRSAGERFLYYFMSATSNKDMLVKQRDNLSSPQAITDALKPLYYEYVHAVKDFIMRESMPEFKLTPDQYARTDRAVIFCVKSKSTIRTDYRTGAVAGMPQTASIGRDNRAFMTLLKALQIMDAYENKTIHTPVSDARIDLIEKCAYSAICTERRKILEVLADTRESMSGSEIGLTHGVGMPKEAVEKFIAPLHAVGIINRHKLGTAFKWFIGDENTRAFILKVSAEMQEEVPPELDKTEGDAAEEEEWGVPRQREDEKF